MVSRVLAVEESDMELSRRANEIALQAIRANAEFGSTEAPAIAGQRTDDCLRRLEELFDHGLNDMELTRCAAAATYRANYYLHALLSYEEGMDQFLTALEEYPTRTRSKSKIIEAAVANLKAHGHPLVSGLVEVAQNTVSTLNASANSMRAKQKKAGIEMFACGLYEEKKPWVSRANARDRLWPQVQAEAVRLGTPLTDTSGPTTLYRWLSHYDKRTPSAS